MQDRTTFDSAVLDPTNARCFIVFFSSEIIRGTIGAHFSDGTHIAFNNMSDAEALRVAQGLGDMMVDAGVLTDTRPDAEAVRAARHITFLDRKPDTCVSKTRSEDTSNEEIRLLLVLALQIREVVEAMLHEESLCVHTKERVALTGERLNNMIAELERRIDGRHS